MQQQAYPAYGDVFGRERHGLTNEEMQRCQFLVNIPSNPEYSSLNLAQAVQIIGYELRVAAQGFAGISVDPPDWEPVDDEQMERLFEHLEQTLLDIRFLNPKQPKRLMMRLRRLFKRARPDQSHYVEHCTSSHHPRQDDSSSIPVSQIVDYTYNKQRYNHAERKIQGFPDQGIQFIRHLEAVSHKSKNSGKCQ